MYLSKFVLKKSKFIFEFCHYFQDSVKLLLSLKKYK